MGYRQSDLQPAFNVPGTHDFTVWGYGTTDTLDEVLQPGYMHAGSSILRPGDLIYIKTRPRRDRLDGPEEGETRVAIVMVRGFERGCARLRLAQDFGRPEDGNGREARAEAAIAPARPVARATPGPSARPDPLAPPASEPPARRAARLPGRRSKMA
jgi:hypothetical protein